jgi:hypothetical protein
MQINLQKTIIEDEESSLRFRDDETIVLRDSTIDKENSPSKVNRLRSDNKELLERIESLERELGQ